LVEELEIGETIDQLFQKLDHPERVFLQLDVLKGQFYVVLFQILETPVVQDFQHFIRTVLS
jgi:hypothetical protein